MPDVIPFRGALTVIPPAALDRAEQRAAEEKARAEDEAAKADTELTGLASYIDTQFDMMKRHRSTGQSGWNHRLLAALRIFNGQYDSDKLNEIRKFGGSEIYARVVAMKCRGASALLRDVYLNATRPWGLDPDPDPSLPPEIMQAVQTLVMSEAQTLQAAGQPVDVNHLRDRTLSLIERARQAAKKKAAKQCRVSEDKIEEILVEGGFYKALAEFLTDLPLFPFAVMKGPEVRILPKVVWQNGKPVTQQVPKLTWGRKSPFDIWFTPGVSDIEDASVIERVQYTRADLNDLLDLPGYNHDAVREVLDNYGRAGFYGDLDPTDSERATQENRENPHMNLSGLISGLEFHGSVQGRLLLEAGMTAEDGIDDEMRDYFVQAWKIGRYIIKVQLAPSPRKRHPYYITSFEKVPGTPVGNALPDVLGDIQEAANATLRSLLNNMSLSSGPQVVINRDRLADDEDADELYPWKHWYTKSDPMGGGNASDPPVNFFQPGSNAQELLGVYQKFVDMADELSGIPKYLQGSGATGGAGRTASGLAMLMGNANKLLQTVCANVDNDVIDPAITNLLDMLMLTDDSGLLTGQETVKVLGVTVATQRETQRARQLEFLQITANPMDAQIMGPKGRATVLREVSHTIGLDGEEVVPSEDELDEQQQAAAMGPMAGAGPPGAPPGMAAMGAAAQGSQSGGEATRPSQDMGPRTNLTQKTSSVPRIGGG